MDQSSARKGSRVKGKVAIVTGAGSSADGIGNGRACAVLLATQGAKIVLVDNNEAAVQETAKMIDDEGGECIVVKADVSNLKDCEGAVQAAFSQWGYLDILINNVGTSRVPGNAVELNIEDWEKGFRVNVTSMMMMVRFFCAWAAIVPRHPSCIRIDPSPSMPMTRRLGCANATPRAIGHARPMLPSM